MELLLAWEGSISVMGQLANCTQPHLVCNFIDKIIVVNNTVIKLTRSLVRITAKMAKISIPSTYAYTHTHTKYILDLIPKWAWPKLKRFVF